MDEAHEEKDLAPRSMGPPMVVILAGIAVVLIATIVLFMTQNPGQGGPKIILLVLLLVFVLFFLASFLLIRIFNQVMQGVRFSSVRMLYTAVAFATGGVYLIGLQTLRQLQVIDIVLVIVFELLLNFYLLRRF